MASVMLDYGPYNSKKDSPRVYDARDIGRMFDGVITDGVFPWIGEAFKITKINGLSFTVGPGRAWFNHTWNYLDSPMTFKLKNGDASYPRYDAVILQINSSELIRENKILVVEGTPGENPTPPQVINDDESQTYEYVLGYIYLPTNANEIPDDEYDPTTGELLKKYIYNIVGFDSDRFYPKKNIAGYAYAVGDNHIGAKTVYVSKDDALWVPTEDEEGTIYYVRNINVSGIDNNNIMSTDIYIMHPNNVAKAQTEIATFGSIYRYEVRDNVLTLYAFFLPDIDFSIRFVGKGVNNIS